MTIGGSVQGSTLVFATTIPHGPSFTIPGITTAMIHGTMIHGSAARRSWVIRTIIILIVIDTTAITDMGILTIRIIPIIRRSMMWGRAVDQAVVISAIAGAVPVLSPAGEDRPLWERPGESPLQQVSEEIGPAEPRGLARTVKQVAVTAEVEALVRADHHLLLRLARETPRAAEAR
jgi:hypothetical protein